MSPKIESSKLTFEVPAYVLEKEKVVFFDEQFLRKLPDVEFKKIEAIVAADPYLNGGRGQEGDKVLVASPSEAVALVAKYSKGELCGGEKIEPLSADAQKAFKSLVAWFVAYRNSFPDPSETEPLENHVSYLKLTREGEMNWGICVAPDPKTGRVAAAFSGQVLSTEILGANGKPQEMKFGWGEHLFVPSDLRGAGLGRGTLEGFEKQMNEKFGKTACTIIEVDNPYGILDHKDPANRAYFDHSNITEQRKLWTDPEGQNMAMNPFERMRVWHKMGFALIAVDRTDLPAKANTVAFPYNQVPLADGADPCETIFLAVRIQDPKVAEGIAKGSIQVKDFNSMYASMQATVTEDFANQAAFKASQQEIAKLVGENAQVRLIPFCLEGGKTLNPQVLEIMQRTAAEKLTEEKYKKQFAHANLGDGTATLPRSPAEG